MAYFQLQSTFDKGEISPLLGSRADVDFWRASLEYCRNFNVLTHGGLRRRSGTRFIQDLTVSTVAGYKLFPFKFSEDQSYVLAFLPDQTMRFFSEREAVTSGGVVYGIPHPYAAADIQKLSFTQFNDVAYFAHRKYAPRKLSRLGDANWSMANAVFEDGPYMDLQTERTTYFSLSDYGSVSPAMTSNTAPEGTVASSDGSSSAYVVFDKNKSTTYKNTSINAGWISYTLASGQRVCDAYWVRATSGGDPTATPASWELQGWNGSSWVTLDVRQNESGWGRGEVRFYDFPNTRAFSAYRFEWLGTSYSGAEQSEIAEIGMHWAGDDQAPITMTASSTTDINDGAGFVASDVGRTMRLSASDGRWRWVKITSRISSTQVQVRLYGHALPDLSQIQQWQIGAFSSSSGFPGAVTLFNERVMWARTDKQPVTVFGSKQGNFENYGLSDPQVETDGLSITLLSSNQNEILWLADDEDLVTGSAGQIRTIGPADLNKSFSATNITQRKGPTSGAAHIRPLSIGGVTLYAGSGGTKIRELVLGDQNRYVAPELSLLGEHLFKTGIVDWSFCERPDPQIYCAMGDGSLVSVTYDREQKIVGFAKHEIAGGFVESVAVVPGVEEGFDDVYLVVRRTINGATKRYIEVMERPFDGDIDTIDDAFHVDCGASYSGAAIQTVTGLGFLEGQQVIALADGNVVDGITDDDGTKTPLVVSGGSVTLPYAASRISIGLRYRSRAITLPVAGPQQDGTLFGRNKTIISAMVDLLNSGSCRLGCAGDDDWQPPIYEQVMKRGGDLFGSKLELRTGFVPCELDGSWIQGGGRIVMETDEPLPLLIRSLVMQLESTP